MLRGQFRKRLERSMKVSWREQPTSHDVAAMRDHRDKMGLVIRTRWQITSLLLAFTLGYFLLFGSSLDPDQIKYFGIPFTALLVTMLGLNGIYQLTYRRLANVAFLNWAQLLLDVVYIAGLVYLSGGIASLMWPLMMLVVIEGAVIIGPGGAWGLGIFSVLMLGITNLVGAGDGARASTIPFSLVPMDSDALDRFVIFAWQAAVILGMALTTNSLLHILSRRPQAPASRAIVDEMTGLLTSPHFRKMLDIEVARAARSGEGAHLLLIDLDSFGAFNERFGMDAGDAMIAEVSRVLSEVAIGSSENEASSNLVARLGGEEFGVLYVESTAGSGSPDSSDAARLAEVIRDRICNLRVEEAGATVSIGIATAPDDGMTAEAIFDAADAALSRAVDHGGNRIEAAGDAGGEEDMVYLPIGPFDL